MASTTSFSSFVTVFMLLFSSFHNSFSCPTCDTKYPHHSILVTKKDIDLLQFPVNLEFLEAEWFLWGGLGHGLDVALPELTGGGPPPIGVKKANLDPLVTKIVVEFAYQEVGHLRALKDTVGLFPRPQLDLSASNFATVINLALNKTLEPPFDPYSSSLAYMLASYAVPYVGLVGYVGTNPHLKGYKSKRLLAGLLGVESGQDAVIRTYLYERAEQVVEPYNVTVAEITTGISLLRNKLAGCGNKDEGVMVPLELGAENKTTSNVLSANAYSISYDRTQAEILRIIYGTGKEDVPGLFYPKGGNGKIARRFLNHH
ncbi:hypothetical protein M9H77_27883 [Catharanthus roseus]|uniref:Uncharacterized protein n=1 Tax=Catharanthus roseus TaxID=4058 RepID=A0ACC0AFN1_CATRO|nr:hypothetical protein M9H77_27883 [Catharanthus roseus]